LGLYVTDRTELVSVMVGVTEGCTTVTDLLCVLFPSQEKCGMFQKLEADKRPHPILYSCWFLASWHGLCLPVLYALSVHSESQVFCQWFLISANFFITIKQQYQEKVFCKTDQQAIVERLKSDRAGAVTARILFKDKFSRSSSWCCVYSSAKVTK